MTAGAPAGLPAKLAVRRTGIPDGQKVPGVQRAVATHDAVVPTRPVAVPGAAHVFVGLLSRAAVLRAYERGLAYAV